MLIMVILFGLNICWAVLNWKNEFDLVIAVFNNWSTVPWYLLLLAPFLFLADLGVTGAATSIFGFSGFYGSAMALLMSNILSIVFFTPKGEAKEILNNYRGK
ncbi:MAG: hypothetical protein KAS32_09685 [Candidatus Peribacteraceae bacterium]|nr:hypothetical protein [Candidatus Peribacteraceae bacterium]